MKTYFSDLIPKLQRYSEKLDNLTLLTNQHWVLVDEITQNKTVYIFRASGELLVSKNGKVEKAKWEYLGNQSILIDTTEVSYLFKQGFADANVIALKLDSKEEYALFVNENKYEGEINSFPKVIDFLTTKYIDSPDKEKIQDATGVVIEKKPLEIGIREETVEDLQNAKLEKMTNLGAILIILIVGFIFLLQYLIR